MKQIILFLEYVLLRLKHKPITISFSEYKRLVKILEESISLEEMIRWNRSRK